MDFYNFDGHFLEKRYFIDEALEDCHHIKVKIWLLDNAIRQFTPICFLRRRKHYLPAEVFSRPGMTEPEMTAVMIVRGATKSCIQYARRKYREANESDDYEPLLQSNESFRSSEDATRDSLSSSTSRSTNLRKSWKWLKKIFF